MPVTALIPTMNDEPRLADCLKSVSWADEIVVVDSGSTDRTVEIAREFNARVLTHPFTGFTAHMNWAIPQCSNEWIFAIDSDERATPELSAQIRELLAGKPDLDFYTVVRDTWYMGRLLRGSAWSGERILRLYRRDKIRYGDKTAYPEFDTGGGKVGALSGKLLHYTYRSMDNVYDKGSLYSTLWARDCFQRGKKVSLFKLFFRPAWAFFHMYVLRRSFLDGRVGFIVSMNDAAYTIQKYVKLWALWREKGKIE